MARKQSNPPDGDPRDPAGKRARAVRAPGPNPLGGSPWGSGPIDPADLENAILLQMGPAADAVLQLEHGLETGIVEHLATAESAVESVDSAVQQQIAAQFVPAYNALSTIGRDITNAARSHMADAALYLSALEGEPVHLTDVMAMPLSAAPPMPAPASVPPGKVPAILPPGGPGPQTPIVRPPQRLPTTPYTQPAPPAVVPFAVPGAPGLPNPGWGQAGPTGPVATATPAQGSAGVFVAPQSAAAGVAKQGLAGHNTFDPTTGAFTFEDPDEDPPGDAVVAPDGTVIPAQFVPYYDAASCKLAIPMWVPGWDTACPAGWQSIMGSNSILCWLPNCQAATPSPTPTTPSPTPTTPSPTPTTPSPTPTTPSPTPTTPSPTPTTPSPTPTAPPGCQQPLGGPASIGLPAPAAGWEWVWNQQSCSYYQQPIPQIIPVPPDGTSPTPTPTQPAGGGVATTAPGCGLTKDNPCWVAASAPQEGHHSFNVESGVARHMVDKQVTQASVDGGDIPGLKVNPILVDQADSPINCTFPYRMSLIDPGSGMADIIGQAIDIEAYLKAASGSKQFAGKMLIASVLNPLGMMLSLLCGLWNKLVQKFLGSMGAANACLAETALGRTVLGMMNFITFGALSRFLRIYDYASGSSCPVQIPTADAAATAWLAAEIDDCTFQAYVMANDQRYLPYKAVARSGKHKFTPTELITLDRRGGMIRGTLASRMREQGMLHQEDLNELSTLFMQVPAAGDLIRFMVRDTANAQVVERFQMDTNFAANYAGDIKGWAEMQGLTDVIMQHNWRAHWTIPAPTQLYVMLHRLRHDDQYAATHDVEGDVREALIQQDILPYWIEGLMKVSYHPLNRTDLNRAYERGWIDDDAYVNGMYQNGYSDDDAQTLLKFAKNERTLAIKASDFGARYVQGLISEDQAVRLAHAQGFDPSMDDAIIAILDPLRDLELQHKQVTGLIHQYKKCWISKKDLLVEADAVGIPEEVIDWQLQWADEDLTCGSKRETVAALCTALDQGVITASEYVDRMRLLKFDQHAIDTYLTLCTNKIKAAQARREAQQQAAAAKEQKQEQAAQEKAAKQAAAQANRVARMLATAERKRQARNKMLEEAANRLGQYLSDVSDPPSVYVQGLYHQLIDNYQLSQDEAASILNMASSKAKGMTTGEFTTWAGELAHTSLSEPWLSYFPEPSAPNGHP